MKIIAWLLPLICLMACSSKSIYSNAGKANEKVLFICTSESTFNGYENGTFLSEIAVPIYEFHKNNVEVDILSPRGGAIPIYYKFDTTAELSKAIASKYYQAKIKQAKQVQELKTEDYAAIVIPGGYGQFLDLHSNAAIKSLIIDHYEKGGIIGSIGHGTALLAQLKLQDGTPLVQGVTMTCFPNWNEMNIMVEANKGALLPFLMEDELRKNGADLKIYDHEKKINFEILDEDKRIVTAAFASGGEFVSNEILRMMKVKK